MAKQGEGNTPAEDTVEESGVYVSEPEMQDLAEFLQTIQQYLLSHEARITAIEGVLAEMFTTEGNLVDEPTDDSPEG